MGRLLILLALVSCDPGTPEVTPVPKVRSAARFGHAPPLAPSADPIEAARAMAARIAPENAADLQVRRVVPLRQGGAVVTFAGIVEGFPVLGADVTVLVTDRPIAWSAGPGLGRWSRSQATLGLDAAAAVALADAGLPSSLSATGTGADGWTRLSAGNTEISRPVRARRVWLAAGDLRPAWEIEVTTATSATSVLVSAADGRVLRRRNLMSDADYRVWADSTGYLVPADSPFDDWTPHPTGTADGKRPSAVTPSLVTEDGFAPASAPDPWLATGATESSGNNADAYVDIDGRDGFTSGDFRADMTASDTFDRTYDTTAEPWSSKDQRKASIASAFYATSWLHDWYYDSGFTETAGNAQASNYGRGGEEGDAILVEVQDYGGSNNANMSTPADGDAPRMQMYLWSRYGSGPVVDGALDNTVVSHEWGHYLHHRLATADSDQGSAMSEGWADFVALHLMLRDGDDLSGAYPVAQFAATAFSESGYYGIRRTPYSADSTTDPLSFRHIADGETLPSGLRTTYAGSSNSEEHNAGEVWASVLFDVYVTLQDGRDPAESFDDIKRRMSDIVVASLALQPENATFTEARDALLAATEAVSPDDVAAVAEAFAGRGMGSCAESPETWSTDFSGVVEDFGVSASLRVDSLEFADGATDCDGDGILDSGEQGVLTVTYTNVGGADLVGAELALSADDTGVTFPDGDTVALADLGPWESATLEIPVAASRAAPEAASTLLTLAFDTPDACATTVSETIGLAVDADVSLESATTDGFDVDADAWTLDGDESEDRWGREQSGTDWVWVGADGSGISDTRLVSPELEVSTSGSLILTFDTRWSFETSSGVYWDGGVVEIAVDGGAWTDVSTWDDPGYNGTIYGYAGNPLAARSALVGTNPSWPSTDAVTLDLGTSFAGKKVQISFRVGTDPAAGGPGWEIDDVAVSGLDNTPFPSLVSQPDEDSDGWTACMGDCDEADAGVSPGASEGIGDGVDQDCSGDELCYSDEDADGARGPGTLVSDLACAGGALAAAAEDCDDTRDTVAPGLPEACDRLDDDCDGVVPAGELDGDADGLSACEGDCDDSAAGVRPGAAEIPGDGIDEDCDGSELCYVDADGDGARTDETVPGDLACNGAALATALDCDDGNASVHPGASEACDGADTDCDGAVPEDELDGDGDGWSVCGGDCDDGASGVSPGAPDLAGDGVDADCDGIELCFADADGDGARGTATVASDPACTGALPVTAPEDCDDTNAAFHPDAGEVCDGLDGDCDGAVPDAEADTDGDGAPDCAVETPETPKTCACASAPGAPGVAALGLLAAFTLRRRHRGGVPLG